MYMSPNNFCIILSFRQHKNRAQCHNAPKSLKITSETYINVFDSDERQKSPVKSCLFMNLKNALRYVFSSSKSSRTFKPKKNIPEGTHQYDLIKHAAATLGSGNLRSAVVLPEGEDLNEWVAVNSKFRAKGLV